MSFVARITFAFAVMVTFWFLIVTSFTIDDIAVERAISVGRANLVSEGSSSVNDSTAGQFSIGSVKDISFINRFFIIVEGMPWWFNLFLGLINGFGLFLMTVLWILKVVHGE